MNVVTVTYNMPPRLGGMAAHVWELNKALAGLGHKVRVLTASDLYSAKRTVWKSDRVVENDGVQVFQFGAWGVFRHAQVQRKIAQWFRRNALSGKDTIVHVHDLGAPSRVGKMTQLPMVWTNHSSPFLVAFADVSSHSALAREIMPCTWVTAPSVELLEKTVALGFPRERATYIPNGVDVARFLPRAEGEKAIRIGVQPLCFAEDTVVVTCARRFVWKNGLHVLVDALTYIHGKWPRLNAVFLFAGNTELDTKREYGREILGRLEGLRPKVRIHLLGEIPNDRMQELWAATDICVLPSLLEATSISGLEAMSCGVAVVGTNVGGIPEILRHEETGLLCPPNDAVSLAEQLMRLISNQALRKLFGAKARQRAVSEFAWRTIAERFVTVYSKSIAVADGLSRLERG